MDDTNSDSPAATLEKEAPAEEVVKQVETPAEEPVKAEEKEPEDPAVATLKTELAEAVTRGDRLEQTNKSIQGNIKKGLDLQSEISRLRREGQKTNDFIKLLVGAQTNEDAKDNLGKDLLEVTGRYQQEDAKETTNAEVQDLWQDLHSEAEDAGLNLQSSPELVSVRAVWDKGFQAGNTGLMRQAVRDAAVIRREAQKVSIKATEEEATEKLRETGALDTPTPRAVGKSGSGHAETWAAFGRGELPWSPRVKEAGESMGVL